MLERQRASRSSKSTVGSWNNACPKRVQKKRPFGSGPFANGFIMAWMKSRPNFATTSHGSAAFSTSRPWMTCGSNEEEKVPGTHIAPLAIVSLGIACCAYANMGDDSYPTDLSKWIATGPPRVDSAIYSRKEWGVFLRDGRPAVRVRKREEDERAKLPFAIEQGKAVEGLAGQIYAAKVADRWIIGFNAGEFGAGLWWFSPDGKRRYRISNDQVCGFLQSAQGLLALEGLSHLGIDRGQIIRVSRGAGGEWTSEPFVDLGQASRAGTRVNDGSLIVVTTDRLLRVRPNTQVDILLERAIWNGLYPNSVIIDGSGAIYIGMRGGVAKITQVTGKRTVTWLRPNQKAMGAKKGAGELIRCQEPIADGFLAPYFLSNQPPRIHILLS
jgi:hypothetical protein